jgi:DnaJ domain
VFLVRLGVRRAISYPMTFRVPRPKPGYDLRSLPLKPAEAFLLSRIDGALTERDLALITGMSHGEVVAALGRLREFDAIELDGDGAGEPPRAGAGAAPRAPTADRLPAGESSLGRDAFQLGEGSRPLYDPAELDEVVELASERKRRILDLYYRLEDVSHYELLGVTDQADKKQIKSAYYLLAPEFHPDSYFRKQLGSYKQKIEAIFMRITLAHDTLTSKQKRVEYDQYLEQTHKNRAMAALIEQTPRDIASITSAVDESAMAVVAELREPASPGRYSSDRSPLDESPGAASPRSPAQPAPAAGGAAAARPMPARPAVASALVVPPPPGLKERRGTFARKLLAGLRRPAPGGGAPIVEAAPPPPSSPGEPKPESVRAAEALKGRFEVARQEALQVQIDRYSAMARTALDRKDFAGAANAYRIAASLAPEDDEIQKVSSDVQRLAAAALAEGYLKQAHYEEEYGRWTEAALSYAKVCNGRPEDARAHERVAYATLQSGGNMRRAVEFARRAVELVPDSVEYRLTLALTYSAAGFAKSATGEIDRAAELARNDARMRDLVAQAREQARKHAKQP